MHGVQPSDNVLVENNGQLYRATIQRVGKRKVTDKEGRELVSEGEYMCHYTYGKTLGFGYFGQVPIVSSLSALSLVDRISPSSSTHSMAS